VEGGILPTVILKELVLVELGCILLGGGFIDIFLLVYGDSRLPLLLALIGVGLLMFDFVVVGGTFVGYGIILLLLGDELIVVEGESVRASGGLVF
jgi:hypothetical protein